MADDLRWKAMILVALGVGRWGHVGGPMALPVRWPIRGDCQAIMPLAERADNKLTKPSP
jgi:hypothetical protein